jgi:ligand-binding sensor domain-containing protein
VVAHSHVLDVLANLLDNARTLVAENGRQSGAFEALGLLAKERLIIAHGASLAAWVSLNKHLEQSLRGISSTDK